jgi:hypothetical protein
MTSSIISRTEAMNIMYTAMKNDTLRKSYITKCVEMVFEKEKIIEKINTNVKEKASQGKVKMTLLLSLDECIYDCLNALEISDIFYMYANDLNIMSQIYDVIIEKINISITDGKFLHRKISCDKTDKERKLSIYMEWY